VTLSSRQISSTPDATPSNTCQQSFNSIISIAGSNRHMMEAANIIPAQKPKKMSFHLCGIFLMNIPKTEPISDEPPNPIASVIKELLSNIPDLFLIPIWGQR
jgi:hypothetical protein